MSYLARIKLSAIYEHQLCAKKKDWHFIYIALFNLYSNYPQAKSYQLHFQILKVKLRECFFPPWPVVPLILLSCVTSGKHRLTDHCPGFLIWKMEVITVPITNCSSPPVSSFYNPLCDAEAEMLQNTFPFC
jgi:hypothetical protein